MTADLTIVMYHYVRDVEETSFPDIKALSTEQFCGQLDHIESRYQLVKLEDVREAATGSEKLPPKAALLTFDDGYVDHYETVFPILHDRGITGAFFPPVISILEGRLLDANKIHFILAATRDKSELAATIQQAIYENREVHDLASSATYWRENTTASRFDPQEVVFIKRMLQSVLPAKFRKMLTDNLFRERVTTDEAAFAAELYFTTDQMCTMLGDGMSVGVHGYEHVWMDTLEPEEQDQDILKSLAFFESVNVPINDWTMCFPYGRFNESLLGVLAQHGCTLGLTTEAKVARLGRDNPLLLPRLDTNDLPKSA